MQSLLKSKKTVFKRPGGFSRHDMQARCRTEVENSEVVTGLKNLQVVASCAGETDLEDVQALEFEGKQAGSVDVNSQVGVAVGRDRESCNVSRHSRVCHTHVCAFFFARVGGGVGGVGSAVLVSVCDDACMDGTLHDGIQLHLRA